MVVQVLGDVKLPGRVGILKQGGNATLRAMELMRKFLARRPSGPLCHYTNAQGLLGIVQKKAIWATDSAHLNDAQEFKHALDLLQSEIERRQNSPGEAAALSKEWKEILEELHKGNPQSGIYVASFSENPNQLSQWRAYSGAENGYSLGFDCKDLEFLRKTVRFQLVKCVYDPGEQLELVGSVIDYMQRAWRKLETLKGKKGCGFLFRFGDRVTPVLLALKDKSFEEEREWRLVGSKPNHLALNFRSGRFGVVPFCEIPLCADKEKLRLRHVYIGPNAEPDIAVEAVRALLWEESILCDRSAVFKCEIPLRK